MTPGDNNYLKFLKTRWLLLVFGAIMSRLTKKLRFTIFDSAFSWKFAKYRRKTHNLDQLR